MAKEKLKMAKQKLEEKYQETIDYLEEIKKDLKEKLEDDRLKYIDFYYKRHTKIPNKVILTFLEIDTEIVYEDEKYNYAEMKFKAIGKEIALLNEFVSYLDNYTAELKKEKQDLID